MSEDKLLKFDVHLQATMVTGVGWGLEVTGIRGDPPQQVILKVFQNITNPGIFRSACFPVGSWILYRGGRPCSEQDAAQPGGTESIRRCERTS